MSSGVDRLGFVRFFGSMFVVFTLMIMWMFFGSEKVFADSISITIDRDLTIMTMPYLAGGQFVKSTNSNISVITDYEHGYTLGVMAYNTTAPTSLVNSSDNNEVLSTITTAASESDFANNSNATTYTNKWGYLPSKFNSVANTLFRPSPNANGDILDVTDSANATANNYTLAIGARINLETKPGAYNSTFIIYALANNNAQLLTVNYDSRSSYYNGGYFGNDTANTVNKVQYNATSMRVDYTEKYSHSSNIDDDGVRNSNIPANVDTNEVFTFSGAETVHISLTYQTWLNVSWVSFWAGNYPSYTASSNYSSGVKCGSNTTGKYGGATQTTIECDVPGDTITVGFRTTSSYLTYYGYYAVITGFDEDGFPIETSDGVGTSKYKMYYYKTEEVGNYMLPTLPDGVKVAGWATTNNATEPEFANANEVADKLARVNGDTPITLYPVFVSEITVDKKLIVGQNEIGHTAVVQLGSSCYLNPSIETKTCDYLVGSTYSLVANIPYPNLVETFGWSLVGSGSLADTTATSTTFTVGAGRSRIIMNGVYTEIDVTVNIEGSGLSSVTFATMDNAITVTTSGTTIKMKPLWSYEITGDIRAGYSFIGWEVVSGPARIVDSTNLKTKISTQYDNSVIKLKTANYQLTTNTGISKVELKSGSTTVCSTEVDSGYCDLTSNATYDLIATVAQGYSFNQWGISTTYSYCTFVADRYASTTTLTFPERPQYSHLMTHPVSATPNDYTVTVNFDSRISSVTVGGNTVSTSGGIVTLTAGTSYSLGASTTQYGVTYSVTANGTISSNKLVIYGTATLTVSPILYMQSFTNQDCAGLTLNTNSTVYDKRDNKSYTVARLNGGLCWMTKDLILGSISATTALTSELSDVSSFTIPIVETSSNKTKWGTSGNTSDYNVAHAYRYSTSKYVYNWYTATGGTTYTSTGASNSICPKGWKLPTRAQVNSYLSASGGSDGSTSITLFTGAPLSLTNGYYDGINSTAYSNKVYWSSNGFVNSNKYYGYFYGIATSNGTSVIRTGSGYEKMNGAGIRCVHASS